MSSLFLNSTHYRSIVEPISPPVPLRSVEGKVSDGESSSESKVSIGRGLGLLRGNSIAALSILPPPIMTTPTIAPHVVRFRSSAAANALACGLGGFLGAAGVVSVTATSTATVCSSLRIHSITMWPSASAALSDAFCVWSSATTGFLPDEGQLTAIPDGVTVSRGIRFRPPARSLAGEWLNTALNAASPVVFITCSSGTIIDVCYSARMSSALANTVIGVSSSTPGGVYYLALDGPASNRFVPLGLPTTH
jgi:hypothetical protein